MNSTSVSWEGNSLTALYWVRLRKPLINRFSQEAQILQIGDGRLLIADSLDSLSMLMPFWKGLMARLFPPEKY